MAAGDNQTKFDRDSVNLSKYKTAGTSLSRVSSSVESTATARTASASLGPANPSTGNSMDMASTRARRPLEQHSMPPKMLDRVSGKPLPRGSTSMVRESRIREMQRKSMGGDHLGSIRRTSVSSQGSVEDNPANIENLSFNIQIEDNETKTPVAFKFDGQRFNTKETIKLYTGRKYNISIKISPELSLR